MDEQEVESKARALADEIFAPMLDKNISVALSATLTVLAALIDSLPDPVMRMESIEIVLDALQEISDETELEFFYIDDEEDTGVLH